MKSLWIILAALLAVLLVIGLIYWMMDAAYQTMREQIAAAEPKDAGGGAAGAEPHAYRLPCDGVTRLAINWVAGDVTLRVGKDSQIVITESSREPLSEEQMLRCSVENGMLHIVYCEHMQDWSLLDAKSHFDIPAKSLVVEVPADCAAGLERLNVGVVSADTSLEGICGARETRFESVSGSVYADEIDSVSLQIETVSGGARVSGAFDEVDAETVSGSMRIQSARCPASVDSDSVSGSVELDLPADASYTAHLDTVSGELSSGFAGRMQHDSFIVGEGKATFKFDSVSGDVNIEPSK